MVLLLNNALSFVAYGAVMMLPIPFAWWLIAHRNKEKFSVFIGAVRPRFGGSRRAALVFAAVFVGMYTFYTVFPTEAIAEYAQWHSHMYIGMGFAAILPAAIYTYLLVLFNEVFFRGFLLSRLKRPLGLWPAMIVQAALVGILALLMGEAFSVAIFAIVAGMLCAVLNQIVFDGRSIVPSVLLVGTVNFVAVMWVAFTS